MSALYITAQETSSLPLYSWSAVDVPRTFGPANWRGGRRARATQTQDSAEDAHNRLARHRFRAMRPPENVLDWRQRERLTGWTPYFLVTEPDRNPSVEWMPEPKPRWIIRSNRTVVPPLPPDDAMSVLYRDARYGNGEESWVPQWHDPTRWHMAFIPSFLPPGAPSWDFDLWAFHTHSDPKLDPAWYRVSSNDFVSDRPGLWRAGKQLRDTVKGVLSLLRYHWFVALQSRTNGLWGKWTDRDLTMQLEQELLRRGHDVALSHPDDVSADSHARRELENLMPRSALEEIDLAAEFLCSSTCSDWEMLDAVAAFQRAVLEMRGWIQYLVSLKHDDWLREPTPSDAVGHRGGDVANTLQTFGNRRYRGVFTKDERVAVMYASYGVPVWLVTPYDRDLHETLMRHPRRAHARTIKFGDPTMASMNFEEAWGQKPPRAYSTLARSEGSMWGVLPTQLEEHAADREKVFRRLRVPIKNENSDRPAGRLAVKPQSAGTSQIWRSSWNSASATRGVSPNQDSHMYDDNDGARFPSPQPHEQSQRPLNRSVVVAAELPPARELQTADEVRLTTDEPIELRARTPALTVQRVGDEYFGNQSPPHTPSSDEDLDMRMYDDDDDCHSPSPQPHAPMQRPLRRRAIVATLPLPRGEPQTTAAPSTEDAMEATTYTPIPEASRDIVGREILGVQAPSQAVGPDPTVSTATGATTAEVTSTSPPHPSHVFLKRKCQLCRTSASGRDS